MKTISAALQRHLAQPTTSVAMLWKIIRTDSVILGFTDHDQEITFDDGINTVVYVSQQGATASATETAADLTTSNQELVGFLEADAITEADIFANKYDYASIEIRIVNWKDLTMGALLWKKATLGEVKMKNGQFTAELRGLEFYMNTNIGETYGPTCRADLGDARCTIDLSLYIQDGTVSTVSDLRTFVPNSGLVMRGSSTPTDPAPANWFNDGVLTWLTGQNAGYLMEVSTWDGTTIQLFENMPYPLTPGDTFSIEPGCNKLISDCQDKFSNIVNFIGEPFIPGMDQILIYPNASGSVPG